MNINIHLFFFVFACLPHLLMGTQYTYPVATLNNGETILYIHQHNPTHIELYSFNIRTQQTEQMLWSVFNPAGLQLLPCNAGFSFIDNGRLRIKLFDRRSPKSIDFDEPLYNINSLHWIDDHTCYCSAQHNDNFALYELHDDGAIQCLVAQEGKDYMYPQKINVQLFYIERDNLHNNYQIMSCLYQSPQISQSIINFDNTPIIFLNMISAQEGFVLEYPKSIDNNGPTIQFLYHHIFKEKDCWSKRLLFSFLVPTNLLLEGEKRLYESIVPLLPRVIKRRVYFVDCSQNNDGYLEPYFYDLAAQNLQRITMISKGGHCFVPMGCGQRLCYGGTLLQHKNPFALF